jgi:hypothetical protein
MGNLRPPHKSTGKIDPRTIHIYLCAGIVRLGSQAKKCISSCIYLQMLALTPSIVPYYFCNFATSKLHFFQIRY